MLKHLKQNALRVFVFGLFLWIAMRYLLHGSDRREYVERSIIKSFWGKEDQAEKSAIQNVHKPEEPHGVKELPLPLEDHKKEVEVMQQDSKLQIGVPVNPKRLTKIPPSVVHLDLKGAAPRVKYLEQIFPLFASLGASAILMEYEDMFPYNGSLSLLRSLFAYSVEDIMEIKRLATISKLEIIPLVQTFGHLEFVLKHDKYFELREVAEFPNSLNPRVPGSLALLKEMLAQVMRLHPEAKHFHIGCDEVYGLGKGQDPKGQNDLNVGQLYLNHVTAVAEFMTKTWPSVKLLMWDDMMRKISVDKLKGALISKYAEAGFKHVWFASAFKGATGPDQMWTPFGTHLHNHLSWLDILHSMDFNPNITPEGIILTGWQRYEHFSVLCELLPVGIPSLAVCLQTLKHGSFNDEAAAEVHHYLGCEVKLEKDLCYGSGAFAGVELYHLMHRIYVDFKSSVDNLLEDRHLRGAFNRYHRKHTFGNPRNLGLFQHKLTRVLSEWETVIGNLRTQMGAIFFPDTVEEWLEENVNERMDMLREMVQDLQRINQRQGRPKSKKA